MRGCTSISHMPLSKCKPICDCNTYSVFVIILCCSMARRSSNTIHQHFVARRNEIANALLVYCYGAASIFGLIFLNNDTVSNLAGTATKRTCEALFVIWMFHCISVGERETQFKVLLAGDLWITTKKKCRTKKINANVSSNSWIWIAYCWPISTQYDERRMCRCFKQKLHNKLAFEFFFCFRPDDKQKNK